MFCSLPKVRSQGEEEQAWKDLSNFNTVQTITTKLMIGASAVLANVLATDHMYLLKFKSIKNEQN